MAEKKILEGLEAKERLVEARERATDKAIPEIRLNVKETPSDSKRCKEVLDDAMKLEELVTPNEPNLSIREKDKSES